MISVLIKTEQDFGLEEKKVREWAWRGLKKYGLDNCELSIVFVDQQEIRDLNKNYREIDRPTTILSFAQGQATPQGIQLLGDLVICPLEAKKSNLSVEFLIDHGIKSLLSEISTSESLRT